MVLEKTTLDDLIVRYNNSEVNVDITINSELEIVSYSIYKLVMKDNIITNQPYYDYPNYTKISNIDCILVEDTTAGYDFFKALFATKRVFKSENGKSSIVISLKHLIEKGYKNILVFVDLAAFGCHMEELDSVFRYEKDVNIVYMDKYECFEYLLLTTNLVNHIEEVKRVLANLEKYANDDNSLEKYFENLLTRVTANKKYHQGHSKNLNECFVTDCDNCNEYKMEKCQSIAW